MKQHIKCLCVIFTLSFQINSSFPLYGNDEPKIKQSLPEQSNDQQDGRDGDLGKNGENGKDGTDNNCNGSNGGNGEDGFLIQWWKKLTKN